MKRARSILQRLSPVRLWNALRGNPVILKEMRSRMRGWRSTVTLTGFLVLVGGTIGLIYLGFSEAGSANQGVTIRRTIGQSIFYTIYIMELFTVTVTAPGLTSGAIAGEREHQTFDLLRTTLLTARALVTGKLIAAVSFVILMLIAALPLISVGFVFGGVSVGEFLLSTVIILLSSLAFGAVGIFFSSFIRRPRVAGVLAQLTTMIFVVVIPVLALVGFAFFSAYYAGTSSAPPDWVALGIGWLVSIGSPIATSVLSEMLLVQEQTLFFFQTRVGGSMIWVPLPWIGFVIFYPLLTWAFLWLSIRIVRRPAKQ